MKANYKRTKEEGVYVKRTTKKTKKVQDAKTKQDIKKNQRRISRKGIQ